jgi:hypothetical protein
MCEEDITSNPSPRKVCLDDFFDDDNKPSLNSKNGYNKNYIHTNKDIIAKNQQEFGHKKRIKP